MGNDLLISTLAIQSDRKPDWDAARKLIPTLTAEELERAVFDWSGGDPPGDENGELDIPACQKMLSEVLDEVWAIVENGIEHRHLYATPYIVPGWTVWITGGDSWGDSPSDEFDLFAAFLDSGLAEAAGFAVRFTEPMQAA